MAFYTFYLFLVFFVDSLYCWCERNTGRHFIGFYCKNRIRRIDNTQDKISGRQNTDSTGKWVF